MFLWSVCPGSGSRQCPRGSWKCGQYSCNLRQSSDPLGWDPEWPAVAWPHLLRTPNSRGREIGAEGGEGRSQGHQGCRRQNCVSVSFQAGPRWARRKPMFREESPEVSLTTGLASAAVSLTQSSRAHWLKGPALFLPPRQCPQSLKHPWPQRAFGENVQAI